MEIIQHKEPSSFLRKIKNDLPRIILVGVILLIAVGNYFYLPVIVGIIIFFLKEYFDKSYDGWTLNENTIFLHRIDLLKGKETISLNYSEIIKVEYIRSGVYEPLSFVFYLGSKKVILNPRMSIFKCAFILKHLKKNEIPIAFLEGDKEVELYIDGKVETIPIENN